MDRVGWFILPVRRNEDNNPGYDERKRKKLTHVQHHSLLKTDLRFLHEFYEESHAETAEQENTEEEPSRQLLQLVFVQEQKHQSQDKIA